MKGIWVTACILSAGIGHYAPWAQAGQANQVVVTATRMTLPKSKVTKSVAVVTAKEIEEQHARTVFEVLRNVPGVYVRQSGGPGRTASVSIRGTTNDQVLVLMDGVDVSSVTTGSFDFSMLPADSIERIEVLRGGSSTLYGSKAIGGVINIITKRGDGPLRTSYRQEFGTLSTFEEVITTQADMGRLQFNMHGSRFDSQGLGTGDDVMRTHISVSGVFKAADWLDLDFAFYNNDSHVGIDDGSFRPDPNRFLEREQLTASIKMLVKPIDPWEQELLFSLHDDDLLNVDVANPGTGQSTSKSKFNTTRFGMDWLNRIGLGKYGLLTAGLDLRDEEAESTRFTKTVFTWAWFLQHQYDVTERLTLIGGIRNLRHNTFGHWTTGESSISYRVPYSDTKLRANVSQGFRAPDLNELFFPNFGNSGLDPEKSLSFEVGAGQDWLDGKVHTEFTWYHTEVEDLIQAVSVSGTFTAVNAGEAEMEGFEAEVALGPWHNAELSAEWTYTDAEEEPSKEELINVPKNQVGVNLNYAFLERWRLNLNGTWVSSREAGNRQFTKGFSKIDASLSCQATDRVEVYGRVENLESRDFDEVLGFDAPGALFYIGAKAEY